MSVSSLRPVQHKRKSSRVPGGFEPDHDGDFEDDQSVARAPANMHPLIRDKDSHDAPEPNDSSHISQDFTHDHNLSMGSLEGEGAHPRAVNTTVLEEQEMNRRLGDFESSFIPELSHLSIAPKDDTSFAGQLQTKDESSILGQDHRNPPSRVSHNIGYNDAAVESNAASHAHYAQQSPKTPPGTYMTPAPEQQESRQYAAGSDEHTQAGFPNTSALEVMSSSPTAARTVSRVQSMATLGGYETADEIDFPESPTKKAPRHTDDPEATPRKNNGMRTSTDTANTAIRIADNSGEASPNAGTQRRRPKYLNSRSASARLSYDSMASSTTDASDATLGADFALQSGGAAPESRLQRKPRMALSRSTSLGSIVSGVSNMSDDDSQPKKAVAEAPELSTLEEESPIHARSDRRSPSSAIVTPRPSNANFAIPTDTVVTNHVRDLEVPGSFARQYRQSQGVSPEKSVGMATMTPGTKKGLTLKEHRSTVEKLGKENFDLKMKIHFLDQALQRRSEDGVKEMITENVQLKSDRMRLEKDNHGLRKQIRELQKRLDAANGARESPNGDPGYATDEDRSPTMEEEVYYLRERVETTEMEIEKLRSENIAKETEKRRLADMVRSLGDSRVAGSDVGSREERDMWKDMLESETIAREQSEEENKRLREEIARVRQETLGTTGSRSRRSRLGGSVVSRSSSVERSNALRADSVEVERLRHEVSELQKMISAQASTLTSRNKEKERLYQEIEDLKIGRMGGLRSVAGDSIFERSASRARSNSRASNGTRLSRFSEPEREHYETRIGELRDEVSKLRLDNQNLQTQFDEAIAELDVVDAQAQADADQFNEELMLLTQERDNLLREFEEQDQAFQTLKNEAQEEIDGLGDELDAKVDECARLEEELHQQAENATALQNEVRSASEGLVRLEEDAQQNLARYQGVKSELEIANRELENMENNLNEANSKVQRLTVQQESSHNEIAFLREEQDGDKIKIGDMESLLKKVHLNLDSERDRAKDLERRLGDERSQRESVTSQEKQEVQRVINDLNREASGAKDELRRIRKAFSSKEIEVTTYKEKLGELEDSLRHILGDPNASRSSLISTVSKIQRNLEQATIDLDHTSKRLEEHQGLLVNRDALLESSGLECRKIADMLERERQGRRQDKHSFEQSLKSHQQATRALSNNNARIAELEQARNGHRKQLSQLENQFKDQLAERNQVLLTLWKKLSALCGPDWAHNNSLINGNLPSQEVVGNMLFWPGFSRNLLLAAKQVEGSLSNLRDKIKTVERNMWKEYRNLEQVLEARSKKLERIEEAWEKVKLRQQEMDAGLHITHPHSHLQRSQSTRNSDSHRLLAENRRIKAELQSLQQQLTASAHDHSHARSRSRNSALSGGTISHDGAMSLDGAASAFGGGIPHRRSSMGRGTGRNVGLMRHNSTGIVEHLVSTQDQNGHTRTDSNVSAEQNSGSDWRGSPERNKSNLMISTRPFVEPQPSTQQSNSRNSYAGHTSQSHPLPSSQLQSHRPQTSASISNSSDAATITSAALLNMTGYQDPSKWIHRLRELERRLKAEREQRLIDRTGMRKRLEEREAVNEELRRELERERIRRSFGEPDDAGVDQGGYHHDVNYEHDAGHHNTDQAGEYDGRSRRDTDADERPQDRMGVPSLNNRVVEVEGSPVRGRG